jgi:hypothetical protein
LAQNAKPGAKRLPARVLAFQAKLPHKTPNEQKPNKIKALFFFF